MNDELLSAILKKKQLPPVKKFKFESELTEKFGRDGLRVYFLINGRDKVSDILARTGLEENKLESILSFMAENGLIELPLEAPVEKPAAVSPAKKIQPRIITTFRSPAEKKVYDKFGDDGVKVYRLMDSISTPEEIIKATGLKEEELLEMLDFMDSQGLIKLEKPENDSAAKPAQKKAAPDVGTSSEPESEDFEEEIEDEVEEEDAPESEESTTSQIISKSQESDDFSAGGDDQAGEVHTSLSQKPEAGKSQFQSGQEVQKKPMLVPSKIKLGIFARLKIEAELLKRFGQKGMHVYSLIDGKKSSVSLAKEGKFQISFVDSVFDYLQSENAIESRELSMDEIRPVYGEEGISIYEIYGRDGLLIYDLINKRATIKDIIVSSGIDPLLGIEVFSFIHRILGIDIPLDTELLKKQLNIE